MTNKKAKEIAEIQMDSRMDSQHDKNGN